jgi:hypothetical protein
MLVFVYVYLWISLSHMRENMCFLCFWSWFTSVSMIPSNCSHFPSTTWHYFLWLSNTQWYKYTTISRYIVGYLGCFQILVIVNMLWWKSVYRCLYCILSYVPLGRCPGAVSLDHMAVLSLIFWGIYILLSVVVILLWIPTSSV